MPETIPSRPDGDGLKIALLVAQWHGDITGRLLRAAQDTLQKAGVRDEDVQVLEVPGAYELPQAAAWLARASDVDAIVALGCVVRGETPHFDYVAGCCADGLMRVALDSGLPVTMGVITADTLAQAEARSGGDGGVGAKAGNKGIEAADAAVRMAASYRALEARRRRP
jgi:6,7-dimethyl-8-ribityllumazine synthase